MNQLVSILIISLSINYSLTQDTVCLRCICQVESNCQNLPCKLDAGSLSCGYFQIKEAYWIDCGKPGGSWFGCAADKTCSETCVKNYMSRYALRCTGGRTPTCQDYARIHNGGPAGCTNAATLPYWSKVSACLSG